MLKSLRQMIQEMTSAPDLESALAVMVRRARGGLKTHACAIYLLDNVQKRYVLVACEGFKKTAIGQVSLSLQEGLVGWVARHEELINLEDASSHPDFHYVPEMGEEHYRAFLGVPIIHQRRVMGILVVQQKEPRQFDAAEEAFLSTLSSQVASVLARAQVQGYIVKGRIQTVPDLNIVHGIAAVGGIALGQAVVVYPQADLDAVPNKPVKNIEAEIDFFSEALAHARDEVKQLAAKLEHYLPPEELALFDAYLRILDNSNLGEEVVYRIKNGEWAQGALREVIQQHVTLFESMDDDYLQERAVDIKDLGRRVLRHLQSKQSHTYDYPEETILVGDEITVSFLADVPKESLKAIVSVKGSQNSHVAILARAMGVPTIMGAEDLPINMLERQALIIDGHHGLVYINPTNALKEEFTRLRLEQQQVHKGLDALANLPSQTRDGQAVSLHINAGLVAEITPMADATAQGIGLYRTEMLFIVRESFPAEAEQYNWYREVLQSFAPRPVNMRTLDVGGDKSLPYFPVEEPNPFLGWRGLRITLDHPDIFLTQARAMMRANKGLNNLRILLPMVTQVSEVNEAIRLLGQAYNELLHDGEAVSLPPVGLMIEVPSAVYQIKALARCVDFVSVGSNDLTQYLLAVDRNNARVSNLYDSLHPAVLQALLQVVQGAHFESKPVGICGEMAGDPLAVLLLVAMGFDHLSMNISRLAVVKWVIRQFTKAEMEDVLYHALSLPDPVAIRAYLSQVLAGAGLSALIEYGV